LQRKIGVDEAIDHGRPPLISEQIRTALDQSKGGGVDAFYAGPLPPMRTRIRRFLSVSAFAAMGFGRVSSDAKSGNGGRKRASIRCIQGAAAIPR
jgi:hypothetical protein